MIILLKIACRRGSIKGELKILSLFSYCYLNLLYWHKFPVVSGGQVHFRTSRSGRWIVVQFASLRQGLSSQ